MSWRILSNNFEGLNFLNDCLINEFYFLDRLFFFANWAAGYLWHLCILIVFLLGFISFCVFFGVLPSYFLLKLTHCLLISSSFYIVGIIIISICLQKVISSRFFFFFLDYLTIFILKYILHGFGDVLTVVYFKVLIGLSDIVKSVR